MAEEYVPKHYVIYPKDYTSCWVMYNAGNGKCGPVIEIHDMGSSTTSMWTGEIAASDTVSKDVINGLYATLDSTFESGDLTCAVLEKEVLKVVKPEM